MDYREHRRAYYESLFEEVAKDMDFTPEEVELMKARGLWDEMIDGPPTLCEKHMGEHLTQCTIPLVQEGEYDTN